MLPEHPVHTIRSLQCPVTCELFPIYLTIFMVIVLVHSTSEVGSMLLTLRCVEPRDKAMALGMLTLSCLCHYHVNAINYSRSFFALKVW